MTVKTANYLTLQPALNLEEGNANSSSPSGKLYRCSREMAVSGADKFIYTSLTGEILKL